MSGIYKFNLVNIWLKRLFKFLNKKANIFIVIWVTTLSILYSLLSVLRHNHFQSGAFDLGIFDQTAWQYSQFMSPFSTLKNRLILGDHLTLTLPFMSFLFYLWNDVRILLIFQAVWVAFSTIPIYLLIKNRKFSPLTALSLSFIYSLFYGMQFAVFFDFHPIVIGVGLLAWFLYFFEAKKKKLSIITFILAVLTQENMGIAFASIGLIYIFNKKYRKSGIFFIISGLLISLLAVKIVASFSPVGYQYQPKISMNPTTLVQDFFNTPDKRLVWLYSFSWFSFLPLLSPGSILAVFLDLSQYFVGNQEFTWMQTPFLHHRAILAIFLLLGALDVFAFLKRKGLNIEKVSVILVLISLSLQFTFHFPLNKLTKPIYWRNESWMNDDYTLFKTIPPSASLAASQDLVPHLSHRKEIYLVWPRKHKVENNLCRKNDCWWLDFWGKPEYLVLDLHPNQWVTQLLESNENFDSAVSNMEKSGKIKLVRQVNFARLYRINY